LLTETFAGFVEDDAFSRGASIAYFTLFSLAPVLLLVIAVAGLVFGQDAAEGVIVDQLSGLMGRDTAGGNSGHDPQRQRPHVGPGCHAGRRGHNIRRRQRSVRRGSVRPECDLEGEVAAPDHVASRPGLGALGGKGETTIRALASLLAAPLT
jgi:hypothetical protein